MFPRVTPNRRRLVPASLLLGIVLAGGSIGAGALAQGPPPPPRPTVLEALPGLDDPAPALPRSRQPDVLQAAESELPRELPNVKMSPPRPARGPDSTTAFVESLRGSDATIDVLVNQSALLTLKEDLTAGKVQPLIAVGDPTILDFTLLNPRQLRVTGRGIGVTDLTITTAKNETHIFEIRILADLTLIHDKLRKIFPDASIELSQVRDHFVVEGEARDQSQISRIIETLRAYLDSVFVEQGRTVTASQSGQNFAGMSGRYPGTAVPPIPVDPNTPANPQFPGQPQQLGSDGMAGANLFGNGSMPMDVASADLAGPLQFERRGVRPQIINLLRVASSQQVMLKVRIAELNRTAMRTVGANFLGVDPKTGAIVGSIINGPSNVAGVIAQPIGPYKAAKALNGVASLGQNNNTTVFGIFQDANFEFMLGALRQNGLLKILAEPNLVALNGQTASFLAGGEFPVPVPQVGASGVAPTITVRFREFGVRLGFVPYILDGNVIRLTVAPEVSNIDFTIAVTLVSGGSPVPGLNTRKAQTTVELREGQTLAMAGLMQLTLNGNTSRIPGLGDLPVLGPLFSNTSSQRVEKELVVLVTPYLIEPMSPGQVPPTPGDEVKEPNDLEFYFLNRIEARTGKDYRSTTRWDDPLGLRHHLKLQQKYVNGPVGFSD